MHSAVGALPEDVKKATIAGVLFGSTKNKQENAQIKNYPKEQVASYCVPDDGVCWGKLDVTGGELDPTPAFSPFPPSPVVACICRCVDGDFLIQPCALGHLAYLTNGDSGKAAAFLQGKIDQALKGKVV